MKGWLERRFRGQACRYTVDRKASSDVGRQDFERAISRAVKPKGKAAVCNGEIYSVVDATFDSSGVCDGCVSEVEAQGCKACRQRVWRASLLAGGITSSRGCSDSSRGSLFLEIALVWVGAL